MLCDEVETVAKLSYLGDNAGGGCEAAVTKKKKKKKTLFQ